MEQPCLISYQAAEANKLGMKSRLRHRELSFLNHLRVAPHPVLDVVVACPERGRTDACPELRRREVQLLFRKPVVRRQHPVDFVDDGLGQAWPELLGGKKNAAAHVSLFS